MSRETLFTMRMTPEESARLQVVAEHHNLTAASLVRFLVKREADEIGRKKDGRSVLARVHARAEELARAIEGKAKKKK